MFFWALDRVTVLEEFAKRSCRASNCGEKGEDGEIVSCSATTQCGEKRMEEWHRRELQCMRDLKNLIEWMERSELAKQQAAADKASKGRKS